MEPVLGLVLSFLFYLSMLIRWVPRVVTNYKQHERITGNSNFRLPPSIADTRDSGKMGVHKHYWVECGVL